MNMFVMQANLESKQRMAAFTIFSTLLLLIFTIVSGQNSLCGTDGQICAENFTFQVNTSRCGKYSDIFSEPNVTMNQDTPLGNYTYTNTSEVMDSTMYLSEVLLGKAYELYQEEQALLDGAQSCQGSSLKTEFTSTRLNNSQCAIDIDDVLTLIKPILEEKWLLIHYGKSIDHPAESCQDLFEHDTLLPSGKYWLKGSGGTRFEAYCDMQGSNCDGLGGWMRLYKLDLIGTDSNFHSCPNTEFEKYTLSNNQEVCRRSGNVNVCKSATFSTNGQSYNKVCGRATGYQKGTTDSFHRAGGAQNKLVDDNYVDGISITEGNNPRNHIFTFVCGCSESSSCWGPSRCPCQTGQNPQIPKFIGHDDFYCESGSYWHPGWAVWYNEPLWDGQACNWKEAPCCSVTANIPWFYKQLAHPTTHSIEARVCTDEYTNGEDVAFSQMEFYIK